MLSFRPVINPLPPLALIRALLSPGRHSGTGRAMQDDFGAIYYNRIRESPMYERAWRDDVQVQYLFPPL